MKQIKDMTTAEWRNRWLIIAEHYSIVIMGDDTHDHIVNAGLCWAWTYLDEVVDVDVAQSLYTLIPELGVRSQHYGRIDEHRATVACLFAAMTPKEFLEICEAPHGTK